MHDPQTVDFAGVTPLVGTQNLLGAGPLPCGCAHSSQHTDNHLTDYTVSNARTPQHAVHVQKQKAGCDTEQPQ